MFKYPTPNRGTRKSIYASVQFPVLEVESYPKWLKEARKTLGIHSLEHVIDKSIARYKKPSYPPCGATLAEVKFRQDQYRIDDEKLKLADDQYITVYYALYDSIPNEITIQINYRFCEVKLRTRI